MDAVALSDKPAYTYADYLTWHDGRWELIDGTAYDMTPAPSRRHQLICGEVFVRLHKFFHDTPCEVYPAPFEVRLTLEADVSDDKISTVVQPDISVVCDSGKLDERGCLGPPDLVVEILSPSTSFHDLKIKRDLYEKYGVREYWIFHFTDMLVLKYVLNNNSKYDKADIFSHNDKLTSSCFEGLTLDLKKIFI